MSIYNPSNQTPYLSQSSPAPYRGQLNQAPYPGQSNQAPYRGQLNQAPYPGQSNQALYPGQSNQAPYPSQSNQAPYTCQSNQAPYPGQSNQAPYTGKNQISGIGPSTGQQESGPVYLGQAQTFGHQGYAPHVASLGPPLSRIELKISCRNLLDLDMFSKSDPFVVVYLKKADWTEIGRTETVENNLNPDFVKSFVVDYYFEEQQMIQFAVYDSDGKSHDLKQHDYLGGLVTSLGSIVGENGGKIEHPLQTPNDKDRDRNTNYKKKSAGKIIVRSEEVSTSKDEVYLRLAGKKLDKKDFFGKSDPFLVFERANEDNTYTVVHKTEVVMNTLDPQWKALKIPTQQLCNGDYQRTIRISCYDWDSDGSNDLIGSFETSLDQLIRFNKGNPSFYELISSKKKAKNKKYKNSGTVHIIECRLEEKLSFLDYIRTGVQLNFMVAIDFTASNGTPSDRKSLHYNGPNQPSQYVQALQAVGGVLEDYDTDKLFPAFGFGAKVPPANSVMHDFALNFNPYDPNCHGVTGITNAYFHTIHSVQLYGPTNFAPVIYKTIAIARENDTGKQYYILLILTDGEITDMGQTKEAIVQASLLPISIIIIGVGGADFTAMNILDGDDARLSSNGRTADRDIVQFVPFQDYLANNRYDPVSGTKLAQNVLHELPEQLVKYFEKKRWKPT